MRLHQALGNRQAQAHSRGRAVHPNEILEDFLMMFGGDPGPVSDTEILMQLGDCMRSRRRSRD